MDLPRILSSERRYTGSIVSLRLDSIRYPDGHTAMREVVEHPGGAVIVPILPDGRLLLIRQYRHPLRSMVYEFPAGKLETGEAPETCALRELEEETGYTTSGLVPLGTMFTTPGFCDEALHLFLAESIVPRAEGQRLDPGESLLTVETFRIGDILTMISDGRVCDGKTITALFLASRMRGLGI